MGAIRWTILPFALCLMGALPGPCQAEVFDDSEIRHIAYPNWFEDLPFLDLAETLAEATAEGKRGLMVLFTTEGCSYCDRLIRVSLGDPHIAGLLQQHYAMVGLEIFDDRELTDPQGSPTSVARFAEREGVEFSPTLLVYGPDGARQHALVGYQSPQRLARVLEYLTADTAAQGSLRAHLMDDSLTEPSMRQSGPLLQPDPLFMAPPFMLDRTRLAAEQPLLVLFEAEGSDSCREFREQVLADPGVRERLGRFDVARLDMLDANTPILAPDGGRTTPAEWYARIGFSRVPALLLFDAEGDQALQTDTLVLRQRMVNALDFVLEGAHRKGWTYQRFARSKGIQRLRNAAATSDAPR
jgi:thioredoxin-related protein